MKLTKNEKQDLRKLAKDLTRRTFREIIETNNLSYSRDTIFREFQKADIVTGKKQLLSFHCENCGESYTVLAIFWGLTYKPRCSNCPYRLTFDKRLEFPFYYPSSKDYFLYQGKLVSVKDQIVFDKAIPHITNIKNLNMVLLTHPKPRKKYRIHIVKQYTGTVPVTFCNIHYWSDKPHRLVKPTEKTQLDKFCRFCLLKMIKQYDQKKSVMPITLDIPQSILSKRIKLLLDAKILKSIKTACKLNGVNPCTYHEARNNHPDIYFLIQQYSLEKIFNLVSSKSNTGSII